MDLILEDVASVINILPETTETTKQNEIDKPHNGKPITEIEVSPNDKYLVTYSKEDHSIVGWNVEDMDEGRLEPDVTVQTVKLNDKIKNINKICVSDDKKLVYIYNYKDWNYLKIIDMNDKNKKIDELYFNRGLYSYYCTFLNNKFILYGNIYRNKTIKKLDSYIWFYSTENNKLMNLTKINNKKWIWKCEKIYKIPGDYELNELIGGSGNYDKLYLLSDNSIYEWNILTEKTIRIISVNEENKVKAKDIKIVSNEKFICLRIRDKITIYSIGLKIPIASLDTNNDIQLYNFINRSDLYPLLPPLSSLFKEYCWKEFFDQLKKNDQLPKEYQTNLPTFPNIFTTTTQYVFGILDEYVWKIKFAKKINFDESNYDDKSWDLDSDECNDANKEINKKIYNHLNIHLFDPVVDSQGLMKFINDTLFNNDDNDICIEIPNMLMDDKHEMKEFIYVKVPMNILMDSKHEMKEVIYIKVPTNIFMDNKHKDKDELHQINFNNDKQNEMELQQINISNKWNLICTEIEKCIEASLLGIKLLDNNKIVVLTTTGLFIYYFNENNKSISLNYFYSVDYQHLDKYYIKLFRSIYGFSTLPLPNHNSFKFDGWILRLLHNKESFLKYGVELLIFAIKEHKLDLMEEIYKKSMNYFKENENNRMFLSIITSSMPILNEYYPEFISRYSSETNMIMDSSFFNIKRRKMNLHLYTFSQNPQIDNLTQSILWTKYNYKFQNPSTSMLFHMLIIIQYIILPFTLPFCFVIYFIFYILSKFHFINDIYKCDVFSIVYFYALDKITSKSEQALTTTIIFMIPYIKFVNYPQNYYWFKDFIKPQPSPFIETKRCREIYKTWNGEALINFKWNTYGKYYYYTIWIGFIALLGCFTITAIPQQFFDDDIMQRKLLRSSIILGLIHLSFEIRQIIYDPIKWSCDPWNWFDIIAYMLPIYTSIYWLHIEEKNDYVIWLISFSCLFLDIKFLLFLRAFEYFGVNFAIIISVGKQIISFLIILFIIIISFAHAFYVLLSPKFEYSFEESTFNDDTNNPWNMTPMYKVFNNGIIDPNQFIVQQPDENTNMFMDYKTSLFAMYLFLTGDPSALSNWSYTQHPPLIILVVLFSLLIVVYLMNLLIGLLNMAIEQNNNRVSYLVQKAEILAEIELFYLLPQQRRWKSWFPEVMYYYADFDKTREKVNNIIKDKEWNTDEFPKIKQDLLTKLNIEFTPDNETP